MLLSINTSVQIARLLSTDKASGKVQDFYLILQLNNQVEVWLFLNEGDETNWTQKWIDKGIEAASQVRIESITPEMREYGPAYKRIWEFLQTLPAEEIKLRINFGYRRRFGNLLEDHSERDEKNALPCKIITFYSYKGGMGRTTTLATYASYYANQGKRVVMIDCDFEAPGFMNFFGIGAGERKNGIVEYLMDKQFLGIAPELSKYHISVTEEYVGIGKIGAKIEFMSLMYNYKDVEEALVEEIGSVTKNNYQRAPLEREYLEPLVETFFGRYADPQGTDRFGTSYDWFHQNLCNADNTISIRPFLELVKTGLKSALLRDTTPKPILSATYYAHPGNRILCVKNHAEYLANEGGNRGLKYVFGHISGREGAALSMPKDVFGEIPDKTIQKFSTTAGEIEWPTGKRNPDYMKKNAHQ